MLPSVVPLPIWRKLKTKQSPEVSMHVVVDGIFYWMDIRSVTGTPSVVHSMLMMHPHYTNVKYTARLHRYILVGPKIIISQQNQEHLL